MSIEILDCLKRERDICVKNVIPSQNTAFMWISALNSDRPPLYGCCSHGDGVVIRDAEWYESRKQYRAFSLTRPAHMQIYWNKRKCLHKKRVQLPEDWFGTPKWPPFHCFGTPIYPFRLWLRRFPAFWLVGSSGFTSDSSNLVFTCT